MVMYQKQAGEVMVAWLGQAVEEVWKRSTEVKYDCSVCVMAAIYNPQQNFLASLVASQSYSFLLFFCVNPANVINDIYISCFSSLACIKCELFGITMKSMNND